MNFNIQGYYGQKNTGDDALVASTVWGLDQLCPNAKYFVSSTSALELPVDSERISYLPPVQMFRGHQRISKMVQAARCQWTVYGGGSLINDSSGLSFLKDLLQTVRLQKLLGHKVGMIGLGVGPLNSREAKLIASRLISSLDLFTVRDQISAELCTQLDVPSPAIVGDLAFLLPRMRTPDSAARFTPNNNRRTLGVSVCNYSQYIGKGVEADQIRTAKVISVLQRIAHKLDCDMAIFEFNGSKSVGDTDVVDFMCKELSAYTNVIKLPYTKNPLIVLEDISKCDAVLAMRLHSAIFSFIANKPMVMLDYHQKCSGFANQIGLPSDITLNSETFTTDSLENSLLKTLLTPSMCVPNLDHEVALIEANKSFELLSEQLG